MISTSYIFGRKYGANFLTNLIAYYPFNSNANDFSGNGLNGTINNIGNVTFNTAKVGNGINFQNNTANVYVTMADNNNFSFTNNTNDIPFSISMWVYCNAFSSVGNWFINKYSDNPSVSEWCFRYLNNRLEFFKVMVGPSSSFVYQMHQSSLNSLSLNNWYHIVYTDDGTGILGSGKLYINGIYDVENTPTLGTYVCMKNTTTVVRVGDNSTVPSSVHKHRGLVDELAIWKNRELTAIEVLELYTKGNAGTPII